MKAGLFANHFLQFSTDALPACVLAEAARTYHFFTSEGLTPLRCFFGELASGIDFSKCCKQHELTGPLGTYMTADDVFKCANTLPTSLRATSVKSAISARTIWLLCRAISLNTAG
ncbi:MAG: hypothetical protein R3E67_06540 [Pseudomonadales bacterium]